MTKDDFISKLKSSKKAPFLFLGSGFSRHYIGSPTWSDLLARFSPKPLNQYKSILNTDSLPLIATEIAKELTKQFWTLPDDDSFKQAYCDKIVDQSQVLKIKISQYINEISGRGLDNKYANEIEILKKINIDGIITTNWDNTAEQLFPQYTKYIGQKQLITSSSFNVGEIYKIHGCFSAPESLIVTQEDYDDFNRRNAYLAAKLITIFVEHPIVFMGYSISDVNIQELLQSIVGCLDEMNINKLQDNLIFVEWNPDEQFTSIIETRDIVMEGGITLPVTRFATNNYMDVYKCLNYYERKIPANLLREYKKQFYDIVVSEKPENALHVLSGERIDDDEKIQVVYGFGAISKFMTANGYSGLSSVDVCRDVICDDQKYDSEKILTKSIPDIMKHNSTMFLPIYKYLRSVGINNDEDYNRNQLGINYHLKKGNDFCAYSFSEQEKSRSLPDAINTYQGEMVWKAIALIPYLTINDDELPLLSTFISEHINDFLVKKNNYSTFMRKLICFYDWNKYGWQ